MEEFPETEHGTLETAERQAKKQLRKNRRYEVASLRWPGSPPFLDKVARGDLAIEVWDQARVHPHARVLAIRRGKTVAGRPVAYIAMEWLKDYRTLPWRTFRNECASIGLKLGKAVTSREIRDVLQQNRALSLVSPDKLAK